MDTTSATLADVYSLLLADIRRNRARRDAQRSGGDRAQRTDDRHANDQPDADRREGEARQ